MTQKDREALRQWEQYRDGSLRAVPVEVNLTPAEIERKRRHLEANPIEWIQYFFPEYAQYDFAPFQRKAILRCIAAPEHFEVLSWARSLAKSTCVMFIVLYLAVTGRKHNVMLASATLDDARRLLAPYRQQFERNGRLRAFYGDLVNPGAWTDDEFTTKGTVLLSVSGGSAAASVPGAAVHGGSVTNSCSFRAIGAGSAPRGSRNGAVRPDVLLVDDYDTDASVRNPRIVDQMWEWWEKALYGTRDPSTPTLIIFCGNIIARDCCVTRAGARADHWDVVNIRDRQGRSTWPAKNTEEKIDQTLSKISTAAQQTEYFNNPVRPGEVFQDLKYGPIPRLSRFPFLVIYGDPAPGEHKNHQSSTKSVALMGMIASDVYVLKVFLDHELNSTFIDWHFALLQWAADHGGADVPVYAYMENNKLQDPFFQQVFKPLLAKARRERGVNLFITPDEEKKTDKAARIEANLEPLNREGHLILNQDELLDPHMQRLDEQFRMFSTALTFPADGPDCIEGGYRILRKKGQQLQPVRTIPRRRSTKGRL